MTNNAHLSEMSILVADDNHANRLIAKTILERAGHHVVIVQNGLRALNAAKVEAYKLIILDIKMPVMCGIMALQNIRAEETPNKDTLIFALTAYCAPKDRQHFLSLGFDAVLTKPLRQGDLEKAIQHIESKQTQVTQTPKLAACVNDIGILDESTVQNIIAQYKPETLLKFQEQHWQTVWSHCHEIKTCLPTALEGDDQCLAVFRRSVHAINVTSSTIGLARIAYICRRLRNTPRKEIPGMLGLLLTALSESRPLLKDALSGTGQLNPAVQMRGEDETEAAHDSQYHRSAVGN